ncbi:nitronate monooxygenase family protein [Bacillus aquiflavi]|nr:nitronate monooxygenase family protein [Bacillus aquiflavi]
MHCGYLSFLHIIIRKVTILFRTGITSLFGIEHPIIQGGLQELGKETLVTAVSNAGALGLLTAGSYENKQEFRTAIRNVRKQTDKPFGANITIGIRQPMDRFVEAVIEEEVPIVFTSGQNPEPYMEKLKRAGIIVTHVVPTVRFEKKAEIIGCDAVVVVGYECGGHPGLDDISSLTLIQRAVQEVSIPVIAAGGFSTGKSLVAALALGAQGIQMGTRFLLAKENPLNEKVKKHLLHLNETDTVIVKRSLQKPMRVMKTNTALQVVAMEGNDCSFEELYPYISGKSYKQLIHNGDIDAGVISLGQTIGLINEIQSVEKIIASVINEAKIQLHTLHKACPII